MNKEIDEESIIEIQKTFLSFEKEYVEKLVKIPAFAKYIQEYFSYSNEELTKKFSDMLSAMENGETMDKKPVNEKETELSMIACVLAMADKVRKITLSKTNSSDNYEPNGRTR